VLNELEVQLEWPLASHCAVDPLDLRLMQSKRPPTALCVLQKIMNPIEMQPTIEYSGAVSMPGTSSAEGASEAWAVDPRVVAWTADDGKAPPGVHAGHQHVSFAETLKYPPTSDHEPADTYFQPQPPPYAVTAQLQQPMTSASATYPWDHQVPLAQGKHIERALHRREI